MLLLLVCLILKIFLACGSTLRKYKLINLASLKIMIAKCWICNENINISCYSHNIEHLPAISQSCNLIVCVSDNLIILSAKSTPTVPL
jgi:hypothetical protein